MELLNQVHVMWRHARCVPLYTVEAHGLTHMQLRHYAVQVGFLSYAAEDGYPVLVGAGPDSKKDLLCLLESAGYEIVSDEILPARPGVEETFQ